MDCKGGIPRYCSVGAGLALRGMVDELNGIGVPAPKGERVATISGQ